MSKTTNPKRKRGITLSELVAPKLKVALYPYVTIAVIAALIGLSALFLTISQFVIVLVGLVVVAIALARTEFALVLLVLVVPMTNARVNLGAIPLDAVTLCTGLVVISYAFKT